METIGEILENIHFLMKYNPDSLIWIIIPVGFVLLLCMPFLIMNIKVILYALKFKEWKPVDGRIVRIYGKPSEIDAVIEYSYAINGTTCQASMITNKGRGFYSGMIEGDAVKVRVDPSNINNSEISPALSDIFVTLIPVAILLTLGYFFLYGFSGIFVSEYRNHHEINIPAEKTDVNE